MQLMGDAREQLIAVIVDGKEDFRKNLLYNIFDLPCTSEKI